MAKVNTKEKSGFVYIFVNDEIPDIIKIGRAGDAEKRAKSLSRPSGVPGKFKSTGSTLLRTIH